MRVSVRDESVRLNKLFKVSSPALTKNPSLIPSIGGNGAGLLDNVIEAYNFIINNYTPGDALYFFGFSRGAFTARACAGLVWEVGILRPSSMPEFIELYKTYIDAGDFTTDFARTEAWEEFKRRKGGRHAVVGSYMQEVEVIGVFDTVGALGVPDLGHVITFDNSAFRQPYQFHDVELNPGKPPLPLPNPADPLSRRQTRLPSPRPGRTPRPIHPLHLARLPLQKPNPRPRPMLVPRRPQEHRRRFLTKRYRTLTLGTVGVDQLHVDA